MEVFDKISRKNKNRKGHAEPYFSYLNRSTRPSSERVRSLIEEWFSRYPKETQAELRGRLRSTDNIQHQSGFFELYLHELLLNFGYTVSVHPVIPAKKTHPEFLVFFEKLPIFYLEATLAAGPVEERASDKIENVVYDTIDKIDSPNFFLAVEVKGAPRTAPRGKKWADFLQKWLSQLDPDNVAKAEKLQRLEALPQCTLKTDGWEVTFRAIPKPPESRGRDGVRPIGVRFYDYALCREADYIRNAIA